MECLFETHLKLIFQYNPLVENPKSICLPIKIGKIGNLNMKNTPREYTYLNPKYNYVTLIVVEGYN